jgi:hypothetical protein
MARRKTAPDLLRVKNGVADRLRELRTEMYGERGGPELARMLGIPVRTWYNYEGGVTVPAEVVLRLIELTHIEASWLLSGVEPKYRHGSPNGSLNGDGLYPNGSTSVASMLRSALDRLERGEIPLREAKYRSPVVTTLTNGDESNSDQQELVLVGVDQASLEPLTSASGPRFIAARREWQDAESEQRCFAVTDNAMAPLVAEGAYVAYSGTEESVSDCDGKLVIAWLGDAGPIVRWFQIAGTFALLRAENPAAKNANQLVELHDQARPCRFRLVSWISTPR